MKYKESRSTSGHELYRNRWLNDNVGNRTYTPKVNVAITANSMEEDGLSSLCFFKPKRATSLREKENSIEQFKNSINWRPSGSGTLEETVSGRYWVKSVDIISLSRENLGRIIH